MPRVAKYAGGQPGVRLNPRQDERCRAAIQTTAIIKRLSDFTLSRLDQRTGRPVDLSPTQVQAAAILLRKTLPDLATVEMRQEGHLLVDFRWSDGSATIEAKVEEPPQIEADDVQWQDDDGA